MVYRFLPGNVIWVDDKSFFFILLPSTFKREELEFYLDNRRVDATILGERFAVIADDINGAFIGEMDITVFELYQRLNPRLAEDDYRILPRFIHTLTRFPFPYSSCKLTQNGTDFVFEHQPIAVSAEVIIAAFLCKKFGLMGEKDERVLEKWGRMKRRRFVNAAVEGAHGVETVGFIQEYGVIGSSSVVGEDRRVDLSSHVSFGEEFYYFERYFYAFYIEFGDLWPNYEAFHRHYGQHLYAVEVSMDGESVGLIWPDFIYHQPENHLEIGLSEQAGRFAALADWREGCTMEVRLRATGFKDVIVSRKMKKPLRQHRLLSEKTNAHSQTVRVELDKALIGELKAGTANILLASKERQVKLNAADVGVDFPNDNTVTVDLSSVQEALPSGIYRLTLRSDRFATPNYFINIAEMSPTADECTLNMDNIL